MLATPWIVSSTPDPAKAGQPGFWPTAITASAAPAIHSASSVVFNLGQPGTFTVSASATPAPTLSVTGTLPTGVTFDPTTGILAGTPTQSGAFPLKVTAHNGAILIESPDTELTTVRVRLQIYEPAG